MAVTMVVLFTLPVEVSGFCVMWVIFYQSTRRHIPKNSILHACDTVVANTHKHTNHVSPLLHFCLCVASLSATTTVMSFQCIIIFVAITTATTILDAQSRNFHQNIINHYKTRINVE